MRTTRFMSLLFLFLSLSFFFLPEFRQGLQAPAFAALELRWLELPGELTQGQIADRAREAEQKRDARGVAFGALIHRDERERIRLAQVAADLDKELTWVLWSPPLPKEDPKGGAQIAARLQAWDPDNAIPYLYQGEQIYAAEKLSRFNAPEQVIKLADQTAWREAMAKAFAAPRYDSYTARRFEFERTMLRQYGWDRPVVALYLVASMPIPSLLNARQYARLLIELAKEAVEAKRLDEAAKDYWQVAHFGERMQVHGVSLIEKLIGEALQQMAYVPLIPLLQQQGRREEATSLQFVLDQMHLQQGIRRGKDPIAKSSNYTWYAMLVFICAGLVMAFGALTVITVLYVNAKRWIRPQHHGRLFQLMTVAENYAPVLLFLACLGLYICNFPFGQNFKHYMTASGEIHDLEPFIYNVFPVPIAVPYQNQLPIANPFLPLAWYALGGLILAVICSLITGRKSGQPN